MPPRPARPRAALVAMVLLALALLASVLVPLWRPLFLACVLAAALAGLEDRLARRLGGRRNLAAGLLTVSVVFLVLAPLLTVAGLLVHEALQAAQQLQATFQERGLQGIVASLPGSVQGWAHQLVDRLPGSWDAVLRRAAGQGAAAAGVVSGALSRTSSMLFDGAMMVVALYFLLADGGRLVAWFARASPLGAETTRRVFHDLRATGTSVLMSLVATAAVQGAVAGIGYWIAGAPRPLLFALLTFFAAFIPSVGTSIVALPLAAGLLLGGHVVGGIFLAAWGVLVTGTIDNVLKPVLARGGVEIHGAVIFFAMIGGIVMYGALGLIVGPLAVSLVLALVSAVERERGARGADRDPAAVAALRGPAAEADPARHDA